MPKHDLLWARTILIEASYQLVLLAKSEAVRGFDPAPFVAEAHRLSKRLLAVQVEIEERGLND